MKSSDFMTGVRTKRKKVAHSTPVVEMKQRKLTSMLETLLNVESKYVQHSTHRLVESLQEEEEANRILRSMVDDEEESPKSHHQSTKNSNPYDKIDYKSPFKQEKELQKPDSTREKDIKSEPPKDERTKPADDQTQDGKKEKKHYISVEPFKQVAGKMGEDLYAVSDYEYNYTSIKSNISFDKPLPSPRSDDEPTFRNRILYHVIQNLGIELNRSPEIRDFLTQPRENFWHGGSIHAVILNDQTGQLFFFVADPGSDFSTFTAGGFVSHPKQKALRDGTALSKNQEEIINRVKDLGDQYVKAGSRTLATNYKHGYNEAIELRRQLLNALGLGEGYAPPLDRDPQDIEAEREHQAKKKKKEASYA